MTLTKDQARDRYVTGQKISLKELSILTSTPLRTLQYWSGNEGWIQQRAAHEADCAAATNAAIVAATGQSNAEILEKHFQTFVDLETMGRSLLDAVKRAESSLESPIDPYKLASLASSKNQASSIIKAAIAGQRQARSLEYEDLNRAIASLQKAGYKTVTAEEHDRYLGWLETQQPEITPTNQGRSPAVLELLRSLTGDDQPEAV
jgi:hypothetical protein